jgi:hypothetical protein
MVNAQIYPDGKGPYSGHEGPYSGGGVDPHDGDIDPYGADVGPHVDGVNPYVNDYVGPSEQYGYEGRSRGGHPWKYIDRKQYGNPLKDPYERDYRKYRHGYQYGLTPADIEFIIREKAIPANMHIVAKPYYG